MEEKAVGLLGLHRTMAIATNRSDGWPQTTYVGYANDGLIIYFLISRTSQKLANIERDDRISVAVAREPQDLHELKAVYAGCTASEVTDSDQREKAWRLLAERHPNLNDYEMPNQSEAAMMRAVCKFVSVLDYTLGLGHADALTVGTGSGVAHISPATTDDWGLSSFPRSRK